MYAIFAHAFPTHVRATGTGFGIGIGRGGSVLSPIIAGYLFNAGISVPTVATFMALGSLVAAIIISFLKLRPDDAGEEVEDEQPVALKGAATSN
jgi:MFS family permease